jgi:hypothetical protein
MRVFQLFPLPAFAIALIVWGAPEAADAGLLVYEGFDYPAGVNVDGLSATGQNLAGTYVTSSPQDLVTASPGSTYGSLLGSLPSVTGNRLTDASGVSGGIVTVALDDEIHINAGEEIFFSGLFTFNDATAGNRLVRVSFIDDASGDELGFGKATVGLRGISIRANTAATGGPIAEGADNSFSDGQTLWLVGRYFNSAVSGADALELVGYDTAVPQTVSSSFDLSDPNAQFAFSLTGLDIDFSAISSLRFEVRGDNDNFLDELRIGSTYSSVAIPEPVSVIIALTGVFAVVLCRARMIQEHLPC